MAYPDELCQLIIRNMEIIEEAPKVVEYAQEIIFKNVNQRIQDFIESQGSWKGVYTQELEEKGETNFAPITWPEKEGDNSAYFQLWYSGEDLHWLSCFLGIKGTTMQFDFKVDHDHFNISKADLKSKYKTFWNAHPELSKAGFLIDKSGQIYRPFTFDVELLAKEFPDLDTVCEPLDKALNDIVSMTPVFDSFVKSLV